MHEFNIATHIALLRKPAMHDPLNMGLRVTVRHEYRLQGVWLDRQLQRLQRDQENLF
jgi:hypothetical protein